MRRKPSAFEAETPNDLFENRLLFVGIQVGVDFHPTVAFDIDALRVTTSQLSAVVALQQQGSDMRLFRAAADNSNLVMEITLSVCNRLLIDQPHRSLTPLFESDSLAQRGCKTQIDDC